VLAIGGCASNAIPTSTAQKVGDRSQLLDRRWKLLSSQDIQLTTKKNFLIIRRLRRSGALSFGWRIPAPSNVGRSG
jgi:hypothetical protein